MFLTKNIYNNIFRPTIAMFSFNNHPYTFIYQGWRTYVTCVTKQHEHTISVTHQFKCSS